MSRNFRNTLTRRDFLRLAGLSAGIAAIGAAPGGQAFLKGTTALARSAAARSGTLRVGWNVPVSLDPALFAAAADASIGVSIYSYLVTLDQKARIVPSLAKSWTISEDGKTYTFTLESGVKFSDGSDFSAEDVKFTFDRLRDEKIGSGARSLYSSVTSVDVVDATTVKFMLSEPNAPFLAFLAAFQAAILKKGIADPTKEYIGTGPFKVESIDLTDRAVLVARDDYWKKDEPKVEKLELIFAQDITAHVQSLQGGQLDWVTRVPVSLFDQLKADAALTASVVATNQFPNIRIRADRGPGKDVKVRQALKYATDRAKLNEVIYKGLGTLGRDTPIGPLYGEFYSDAVPVTPYDPAKAKELLKEAGFADGLTLDFYGQKGEFSSDELVQVLAEQWKAVGITINIKLSDVYYNDGANNWLDADLAVTNWASRPDPQVYLELMYKSDGVWNEAHWKDEELDTLIAAARVSSDVKKRAEIFKAIQVIFAERGPSIIPFYQPSLALQAKNVSGIELAPDVGLTSFAKAEIK